MFDVSRLAVSMTGEIPIVPAELLVVRTILEIFDTILDSIFTDKIILFKWKGREWCGLVATSKGSNPEYPSC
jgi:hypothetical protein